MTARRAAFFALALAMLVAVLYTGERFYALVLLFQLMLLLLGALHIVYTMFSFRFEQSLSEQAAVKGDAVTLRASIHNEGFVPYARIRAETWLPDRLAGAPARYIEGDIPAHSSLAFQEAFSCVYRGEYEPGLRSIRFADLFGLLSVTVPLRFFSFYHPLRLTVRPRVRSMRDEPLIASLKQGRMDAEDVSAQDVSAVRDVRAFRAGDALKWVHFKLSARRRAVLVREFEGSARPKTLLILDMQAQGRTGKEALEIEDVMVEAATALAHQLLEDRAPVRLVAYGAQRFEAQGDEPKDFGSIYAYMTLAKFQGKYDLSDVLSLEIREKGQHVLLVTASLNDRLMGALMAQREAGNDVAVIIAATEPEKERGIGWRARELRRQGVRCTILTVLSD